LIQLATRDSSRGHVDVTVSQGRAPTLEEMLSALIAVVSAVAEMMAEVRRIRS